MYITSVFIVPILPNLRDNLGSASQVVTIFMCDQRMTAEFLYQGTERVFRKTVGVLCRDKALAAKVVDIDLSLCSGGVDRTADRAAIIADKLAYTGDKPAVKPIQGFIFGLFPCALMRLTRISARSLLLVK